MIQVNFQHFRRWYIPVYSMIITIQSIHAHLKYKNGNQQQPLYEKSKASFNNHSTFFNKYPARVMASLLSKIDWITRWSFVFAEALNRFKAFLKKIGARFFWLGRRHLTKKRGVDGCRRYHHPIPHRTERLKLKVLTNRTEITATRLALGAVRAKIQRSRTETAEVTVLLDEGSKNDLSAKRVGSCFHYNIIHPKTSPNEGTKGSVTWQKKARPASPQLRYQPSAHRLGK